MLEVDCLFEATGRVRVRRVNGQSVEMGRQWVDEAGVQVLVLMGGRVRQLTLDKGNLRWVWKEGGMRRDTAVAV